MLQTGQPALDPKLSPDIERYWDRASSLSDRLSAWRDNLLSHCPDLVGAEW